MLHLNGFSLACIVVYSICFSHQMLFYMYFTLMGFFTITPCEILLNEISEEMFSAIVCIHTAFQKHEFFSVQPKLLFWVNGLIHTVNMHNLLLVGSLKCVSKLSWSVNIFWHTLHTFSLAFQMYASLNQVEKYFKCTYFLKYILHQYNFSQGCIEDSMVSSIQTFYIHILQHTRFHTH